MELGGCQAGGDAPVFEVAHGGDEVCRQTESHGAHIFDADGFLEDREQLLELAVIVFGRVWVRAGEVWGMAEVRRIGGGWRGQVWGGVAAGGGEAVGRAGAGAGGVLGGRDAAEQRHPELNPGLSEKKERRCLTRFSALR